MYILKYKGRHVVRGNKEGMAPKIPDPSCTRRNLCVSDPGFLCSHISSLCRAVRHCPYYSLFSPVSQHYNVLIPGRKCLIGVNNTQTRSDPLRLRESSIYDVSELYVLYIIYTTQPPTYTLDHHAMLRLMSNFEILQTSRYQEGRLTNNHYLKK